MIREPWDIRRTVQLVLKQINEAIDSHNFARDRSRYSEYMVVFKTADNIPMTFSDPSTPIATERLNPTLDEVFFMRKELAEECCKKFGQSEDSYLYPPKDVSEPWAVTGIEYLIRWQSRVKKALRWFENEIDLEENKAFENFQIVECSEKNFQLVQFGEIHRSGFRQYSYQLPKREAQWLKKKLHRELDKINQELNRSINKQDGVQPIKEHAL